MAKSAKPKRPSFIDRYKVKLKIRAPHGVKLSQGETEALMEIQANDVAVLKDNQQEVLAAIGVTKNVEVGAQIKSANAARSLAAATFRNTKDPIKRREWARRLVIADRTRTSLKDLTNRMATTKDRLEMIKGDIELQIIEAEAAVAETAAYAKAGKQLRLAGDALVNARMRAKANTIEYTNLEITMEGAEKLIANVKPDDLVSQAEALLGGTS